MAKELDPRVSEELNNRSREIARAFNTKRKDGINIITDICKGVNPDVYIAEFFKAQKDNLNLEKVGDYLGTDKEQNKAVLKYFIETMEFQGKDFLPAMRDFFKEFKLPGESQKIERLVENFSKKYTEQNPDKKITPDSAFLLAYATTQLNSNLHNVNVKNKMTLKAFTDNFIKALEESFPGKSGEFPVEIMEGIYNDIKAKPFKYNFSEKTSGYSLSSSDLDKDRVYKAFSSKNVSGKEIKKLIPILGEDIEVTVKEPNKRIDRIKGKMSFLFGKDTNVIVTDKSTGAQVNVRTHKPSIWDRIRNKNQPSTTIEPIVKKGEKVSEDSLKLASELAVSFKAPITSIEATYDYEKDDLGQSYDNARKRIETLKSMVRGEGGAYTPPVYTPPELPKHKKANQDRSGRGY